MIYVVIHGQAIMKEIGSATVGNARGVIALGLITQRTNIKYKTKQTETSPTCNTTTLNRKQPSLRGR